MREEDGSAGARRYGAAGARGGGAAGALGDGGSKIFEYKTTIYASEDTGRCTGAVGTGESARMPDGAHDHPSPPILPMPDE